MDDIAVRNPPASMSELCCGRPRCASLSGEEIAQARVLFCDISAPLRNGSH
jgi:hypothetical protein